MMKGFKDGLFDTSTAPRRFLASKSCLPGVDGLLTEHKNCSLQDRVRNVSAMHLIVGSEDVTQSTKNRKKQKDFNDNDFDLRIRFKKILQQNLLCSIHLQKLP